MTNLDITHNQKKRYLTKSRFKLAVECPAKLNYVVNKAFANTNDDSEILESLAQGGHQIGALAQWIYARKARADDMEAIEITGDQEEQIRKTKELLKRDRIVLFEPTLVVHNFLIRVDVLCKRGNQVDLIEVKSKSFDSLEKNFPRTNNGKILSGFLPYLQDVAFQTLVAKKAYPAWTVNPFLMMPDKSVKTSTTDLHALFPIQTGANGNAKKATVALPPLDQDIDHAFLKTVNVASEVEEILNAPLKSKSPGISGGFEELSSQWAMEYANGSPLRAEISATTCGKCEFYSAHPTDQNRSGFHECWRGKELNGFDSRITREETVLGLYKDRKKLKNTLLAQGIWHLQDIPTDLLFKADETRDCSIDDPISNAQRQHMQITQTWPGGGSHYFNHSGFKALQKKWEYPYYFLDFEGARSALPIRSGQKPNALTAFQYSLHVMHDDGRIEHKDQFLELRQSNDPHVALLRQLKQALGTKGTIFRWDIYENTLLNELREELNERDNPPSDKDELVSFCQQITESEEFGVGSRNMVDQCKLAADLYFHPSTRGSSSIKPLLPAVMSESPYLKQRYSRADYGGDGDISSLNHLNQAVTWWQEDRDKPGSVLNPYDLLAGLINTSMSSADDDLMSLGDLDRKENAELSGINNGGAALMIYLMIQSKSIPKTQLELYKTSMKYYCELDTLAMAMIMESWINDY